MATGSGYVLAFLAPFFLVTGCVQSPSSNRLPTGERASESEKKDYIADGWRVFDDATHAFLVRYPPDWNRADIPEPRFRFLASKGPADCGVQVDAAPALGDLAKGWYLSQSMVNQIVKQENVEELARKLFAGRAIRDVSSGELWNRAFVRATAETRIEESSEPLWRKEYLFAIFTPGRRWVLHCGVFSTSQQEAAASFTSLQPTFEQFFKSFAVYRAGP